MVLTDGKLAPLTDGKLAPRPEYHSLLHALMAALDLRDFTCLGEASFFRAHSSACVLHRNLKGFLLAFSA